MSVRIKFSDCVPFPLTQGVWIRLVMGDSPERKGSLVVTQGHVMLLRGEEVIMLDQGQTTNIDIVRQGDEKCRADDLTVSYTQIVNVGITKQSAQKQTTPPATPPNGQS